MIEYGDYLIFEYRDKESRIISRYIQSVFDKKYNMIFHHVDILLYNKKYWYDDISDKNFSEFNDEDMKHATHLKTYEELIAYII